MVSLVFLLWDAEFFVATVACKSNGTKLRTQRIAIFRVCIHKFFRFFSRLLALAVKSSHSCQTAGFAAVGDCVLPGGNSVVILDAS